MDVFYVICNYVTKSKTYVTKTSIPIKKGRLELSLNDLFIIYLSD